MSESTILSSPFLNPHVVNRALQSLAPTDVGQRAQLLSAKILALERDASLPVQEREWSIAETALQRAKILLGMMEDTTAEAELMALLQRRSLKLGRDDSDPTARARTRSLRIRALRLTEEVNERLGRPGRVSVWKAQREKLEAEAGAG